MLKSFVEGNYPIYFDIKNEKNFDPLKDFLKKKNYFHNKKILNKILKKMKKNSFQNKIKDKRRLVLKNFFNKINLKKVNFLLK